MKTVLLFAFVALIAFCTASALPATYYVDVSVSSSGDGTSWETALQTIQEGIDLASSGDTVTVSQGTYIENIHFNGKNIILTSTEPLDADIVATTIIDGNGAGSVVTFDTRENETCVLSGFTIRNGEARSNRYGGGICGGTYDGNHAHATIRRNILTGNRAECGGALACCDGLVESNVVTGNSAIDGHGGGLFRCDGVIRNNTISGNSVEAGTTSGDGGGLAFCDGTVENNVIYDNSAHRFGGGLAGCDGPILNNAIIGNSASGTGPDGGGGGLALCHGVIQNNLICANSTQKRGGGLSSCSGSIRNNTIFGNTAALKGGGQYGCGGAIINCIIWGNAADEGPQLSESTDPTYSCIQGWTTGGEGNVSEYPELVDPDGPDDDYETLEDNNYRLRADSPCIDLGANHYWFPWPQRDLDGNCRLVGDRVDIGCYEHDSSADLDGDLLSDEQECLIGTDVHTEDTDSDGLRDGTEVLRGSDPLDGKSPGAIAYHVPSDVHTIQEAINMAMSGDEIVVASGIYRENLEFVGPDIILRSSDPEDPSVVASTILDGGGLGPVVSFRGGESHACIFTGFTVRNGATERGSGIAGRGTHAAIRNNVIAGNAATSYGGGLQWCEGRIQSNTIAGNSAAREGGGLHGCNGIIQNNVICGNSAGRYGGGLGRCDGIMRNNTIVGNQAETGGGGVFLIRGEILNCIIWGNGPSGTYDVEPCPSYSCIQGWTWGGDGNINPKIGPQFVDMDGPDDNAESYDDNDYRFLPDSPCIDTGRNEPWMWTEVDLDGNPRIWNRTVDMGAYEYGSWFRIVGISQGSGERQIIWDSRPEDTYTVWSCFDLSASAWTEEATVSSQGESTFWLDTAQADEIKFYRIELK
ncbi:hypothetical protein HQ563_02535 [bacterium]|nr:hypothetical protein [bacterium]